MDLERYETGDEVSKAEFAEREPALRMRLLDLQTDVAEAGLRVLVLVIGDDRAGCEEVVDRLNQWMDTRGIDTEVFVDPNDAEAERPPAWRYWNALPAPGRIGVFLGAWAYDHLAASVAGAGERELERTVRTARRLERLLLDEGTLLLRYWVHSPKEELEARLAETKKGRVGWRAAARDREVLEHYHEIVRAGEAWIAATAEPDAPWRVVEGAGPRRRDLTLLEDLAEALERRLAEPVPAPRAVELPGLDELEGPRPSLPEVDASARLEREDYDERKDRLQARLADLAYLASERGQPLVLAFEGPDASGKGGAIRRITKPVAARDYRVHRIAAPTEEERARPYLWRFWRRLPRRGRLGIFDRSWYGRVLVERVEGYASRAEWTRAYAEIVEFERELCEAGWPVLKFWLQIDPEEQLRRFEARSRTPYKRYKLTPDDLRNRDKWVAYQSAAEEMVARTHTEVAPWHVVPANDKRFARCAVLEEVVRAYEAALGR